MYRFILSLSLSLFEYDIYRVYKTIRDQISIPICIKV